ncbi:lactonase family protein [Sinomonas sp. RB5]
MTQQTPLVAIACAEAGAVDLLSLDTQTGQLEHSGRIGGLDGAAALAFGPDGTLYAGSNGSRPRAVVLHPDGETGEERRLPASTCFIAVAPDGRALFSASYGEGRLDRVPLPGGEDDAGPVTYATGRNTHCAAASPDGRFLYATSLGDDRVSWFPLDGDAARSGVREPSGHVATEPGWGPRYLRFNHAGDRAYVVHELSGAIAVYGREAENGRLELLQRTSAVAGLDLHPGVVRSAQTPDPGPGVVWAADLRITPDERFLYTTERSSGTLACFALREGLLEFLGRVETEQVPGSAAIDPTGQFLLVAGEGSHAVTSYRIAEDGSLSAVSRARTSAGPVAVECGAIA